MTPERLHQQLGQFALSDHERGLIEAIEQTLESVDHSARVRFWVSVDAALGLAPLEALAVGKLDQVHLSARMFVRRCDVEVSVHATSGLA